VMFTQLNQWFQDLYSLDNSRVNTGAVLATFAFINAMVILNWNFFVFRKPLDMGTVSLLGTLIGVGGWSYHASVRAGPLPPPDWKAPPIKK
jgi:hypothetical protein